MFYIYDVRVSVCLNKIAGEIKFTLTKIGHMNVKSWKVKPIESL